jgi:hypothetical protein
MVVRGTFDGKAIVLDEPLNIPPDSRVVVHVEPESAAPAPEQSSVLQWIESNTIEDQSLPNDLSRQHDHYLYGSPRKPQA